MRIDSTRWLLVLLVLLAHAANAATTAFDRDGILSARLSPDGDHVAVLIRQPASDVVFLVHAEKKKRVATVTREAPQRIAAAAWIDDESLVLAAARDDTPGILPQPTGYLERLTVKGEVAAIVIGGDGEGRALGLADSLPGLKGKLLVAGASGDHLWIVDAKSGDSETLPGPGLSDSEVIASPGGRYFVARGRDASGEPAVRRAGRGGEWQALDRSLVPIALSDSGTLYALRPGKTGVLGVVAVGWDETEASLLFQDPEHDADLVMFDAEGEPFAVRTQPNYPSWSYLGGGELVVAHKSLRAALPQADLTFTSVSHDGEHLVLEAIYDNRPPDYLLIDVSASIKAERLLSSNLSLLLLGGEAPLAYRTEPFVVAASSGPVLHGLISLPADDSLSPRPAVVLLRDEPGASRWTWGFHLDTHFLNRQGYNVLRVNHRGSPGYGREFAEASAEAAMEDIEKAVRWAIANGLVTEGRVCLMARGEGLSLALETAMRYPGYACVVGLGGATIDPSGLATGAEAGFEVLMIYGGADPNHAAAQARLASSLESRGIASDALVIEPEGREFVTQAGEARALAGASTFLHRHIGNDRTRIALPLVVDQARMIDDLVIEAMDDAARRSSKDGGLWGARGRFAQSAEDPRELDFNSRARRMLEKYNPDVQSQLSSEQWAIYESFFDIDAEGGDFTPFLPNNRRTQSADTARRTYPGQP